MKNVFYLLLCAILLSSCHDDDQATPNDPVDPITDEVRIETLESCRAKYESLLATDEATASQQLLDWLKTQPNIADAGIAEEEKNVWAYFRDGRSIMFVNNLKRVPHGQQGGRQEQAETAGALPVYGTDPAARPQELPKQKKVTLLNGMGTGFIDPTAAIKQIFAKSKSDYDIHSDIASVENLKKIGNDHAIFYLSTHGGATDLRQVGGKQIPATLGFWTTDKCTPANEAAFKDDLDNLRLGYMVAANDEPSPGNVTVEKHYAFTAAFVKEHMSFGENALIYFTACNGFREMPSGVEFRETVISKAANKHAAYLGWTKPIYESDGYVAAKFVFDRLLGANAPGGGSSFPIPQEDPFQRPFDIDAVMKDMATKGLNVSDVKEGNVVEQSVFKCYNKISPDTRFVLTPSIAYLEMYEYFDWLYIRGIFGDDPGASERTVTIDGVKVEVVDWSRDQIQCKIPSSGKGSAGDVVVTIRDHESNPRRLTEWRGTLKYTRPSAGAYKEETNIAFHVRRDVGYYRKTPAANPVKVEPTIYPGPARDTKATYKFGGDAKYVANPGNCTYTYYAAWGNSQGTLPMFDGQRPTEPSILVISTEKDDGFELRALSFLNPKTTLNSVYNDWVCPDDSGTSDREEVAMGLESPTEKFQLVNLVFDATFNIQPGKIQDKGDDRSLIEYDGDRPDFTITLEWSTMAPNFPPDPDQPQ
ncbi:hypothetical protein KK062_00290 [Fulvivirgaceae bacterium PWU5]|uniref:Uncharacterized protein n=1 Tax=Dawidia cretensis TaxID=2782350 RepID=A0AAP2GSX1_9BACT|nr:IPT/TIG domain-containing protein [Dawidia cretensis]MBT1706635.1 hypothetical protein [Dawidia cretensis]